MSDEEVRRLYKVEREEFHRDPDKLLNRLHRTYMRREVKRRGYDSDLSSIDTDAENEYRARNGMSPLPDMKPIREWTARMKQEIEEYDADEENRKFLERYSAPMDFSDWTKSKECSPPERHLVKIAG